MKQVVIIGPTASGKSALAIDIARAVQGVILSVDSLSVYREFDIVSAKPTYEEQRGILHFGIDCLEPVEHFSVARFLEIYEEALSYALAHHLPLIIVGGTGFYIKALLEGLSSTPSIEEDISSKVSQLMQNPEQAYTLLSQIDPLYAQKVECSDRYRVSRGLSWYFQTLQPPSTMESQKSTPLQGEVAVFEIGIQRDLLKERIVKRTAQMIKGGLIDEVASLEYKYSRELQPMRSVGVKEVLDYFDGKISLQELPSLIATHTAQLAKRQQTYNKTQIKEKCISSCEEIYKKALDYLV